MLAIGAAGENLVKFACPLNDDHHVAGRGGMGAVMGSKKLKAIAVRGTGEVNIARPEEFREAVREARERIKVAQEAANFPGPRDRRTIEVEHGCLPGKNFQAGSPAGLAGEPQPGDGRRNMSRRKKAPVTPARCPALPWPR